MKKMVRRGDIYYADLDPVKGSEQGGIRPVIIVQNNVANKYCTTYTVVPVTTKMKKLNQPTHVDLKDVENLPKGSIALAEQIRTLDMGRLLSYITHVNAVEMAWVELAIRIHLNMKKKKEGDKSSEGVEFLLCPTCASQFYNTGEHIIRRVDPLQRKQEMCSFCNVRLGYDYIVKRKKKCVSKETGRNAE